MKKLVAGGGMARTLTKEQIVKMQEGRRRKAAEDAALPNPPRDARLGDAYVNAEALKRLIATGVDVGSSIRIVRGKHKGETHVVESLKGSEAAVFAGGRWWCAWRQPPEFEVMA